MENSIISHVPLFSKVYRMPFETVSKAKVIALLHSVVPCDRLNKSRDGVANPIAFT